MADKARDPLSKIDNELGAHEARLTKKLAELSREELCVKAELKRVQAMRRAGGKTGNPGAALPAPNQAEVLQLAAEILEAGPLPVDKLKAAVESRLRKTHSLSGFSLRMGEVLRSDLLSIDAAGLVSLGRAGDEDTPRSKTK